MSRLRPSFFHPIVCDRGSRNLSRSGSAMLAVVVIAAVISIMVMAMLYRLSAQQAASGLSIRTQQAWSAAMAGIFHAAALVASDPFDPAVWQSDENRLHEQFVFTDGVDQWYFSVLVPTDDPSEPYRHGVGDEAARLHLQDATAENLTDLAGLSPQQAEAIYIYLQTGQAAAGSDDLGGRMDTSQQLTVSSGPIVPATVDELLLAGSITAPLLYGRASHAARRMLGRQQGDDLLDADPDAMLGLRHHLTAWSSTPAIASDGTAQTRIDAALEALQQAGMPESAVDYIRARRDAGLPVVHPAELLDASIETQNDDDETAVLNSGITSELLGDILDRFAPAAGQRSQGLVNVNTAPTAVLRRIPGIGDDLAEQIVTTRENLDAGSRRTTAWLVELQVVDVATFKSIAPFLTTRCSQFRLLSVGYSPTAGSYRVLEAVVDLAVGGARIVYLRETTPLGLPLQLQREPHWGDES